VKAPAYDYSGAAPVEVENMAAEYNEETRLKTITIHSFGTAESSNTDSTLHRILIKLIRKLLKMTITQII